MIEDLLHGWSALQTALPDYEEAEQYYSGETAEWFSSARIAAAVAATGERYRFNLAKTAVNVMADRVELAAVTAPTDATSSALIETVWDANDLDVYYPDLFRKVFIYGDAYLQVWPILEQDPEAPEDPELLVAGVELTVQGPKHCRVIYDRDNGRRKSFAIKRWPLRDAGTETWRVDLYYPDVIEQWVSIPNGNLEAREGWTPFTDVDEDVEESEIPNEFGEIPFFHYRSELPYGRPAHVAGYGCQDAVNKMLITQLTTSDSHGWPQRYSLTDAGAELDQANGNDDEVWGERQPGDLVETGGPGHASGPGSERQYVGVKAVGQFEAALPATHLEPAEFYIRLMAQLTTTPLHYFDPSGSTPSGESLKVAEAPLVKKVQQVEVLLRGSVTETWSFVLRLIGRVPPRLDVRWAPVASATGASDWEVIAAKQAAGVPVEQTLIEAGYESEQVKTWMAERAAAAPPPSPTPTPAVAVANEGAQA